MMYGWEYWCCFYYGGRGPLKVAGMQGNYPRPDQAGKFAIETVHKGEASRDIEIAAGKSREDIGYYQWGTFDSRGRKIQHFDSREH